MGKSEKAEPKVVKAAKKSGDSHSTHEAAGNSDLDKLFAKKDSLQEVFDSIELELHDDPNWEEPSDSSYLSEDERKDPEIMANIDALTETNKFVHWFGRDTEGFVGFWRGPSSKPINECPVVRLDTEGQYMLVAMTIPDYILVTTQEEEFEETSKALTKAGFKVSKLVEDIDAAVDAIAEEDSPQTYLFNKYNENRKARGLPEIDPNDIEEFDDEDDGEDGGDDDEEEDYDEEDGDDEDA